jgi:hypothetical protein
MALASVYLKESGGDTKKAGESSSEFIARRQLAQEDAQDYARAHIDD